MNLEERILSMSKGQYLSREDEHNIDFFNACVKLNRIDLALKCSDFINEEFIQQYSLEILEYIKSTNTYLIYQLSRSRNFRDLLIEKKEYELLIKLDYKILKEITDEFVINELNELSNEEMESELLINDYVKFRAMEQKRFDLFKKSSFPNVEEFYDLYYKEVLKIIDQLENPEINNYYLTRKCMLMGDFDYADKTYKYGNCLKEEEYLEIENQYWDKILEYNDKRISKIFCSSKRLFKHYLEQKRFDLLSQFDKDLLTPEFIKQYEREIIESIIEISNNVIYNEHLFKLCLKYKKYELCSKFYFEPTKELLEEHGKEIIKHYTELPYYLRNNEDAFKILLELEKYELLKDCEIKLFTDEVLEKHGDKIVAEFDQLPYDARRNPKFLISAIKAKRFDLIDKFYDEAFTDEVFTNYGNEVMSNINTIPYFLRSNTLALEAVINTKRFDLVEFFYPDAFTDIVINNENTKEYLKQVNQLPYKLYENSTILDIVITSGNYQLALLFSDTAFTEDKVEKLIDIIPQDSKDLTGVIKTPLGIKAILKKQRYDLITTTNVSRNSFDEEILKKYDIVLLTKIPFLENFKNSNTLLKCALKNNLTHLVPLFSITAFDDEIINEYGNNLLPELAKLVEEYKTYGSRLSGLFHMSLLMESEEDDKKLKSLPLLLLLLENGYTRNLYKFNNALFTNDIIDKYYDKILEQKTKTAFEFLEDNSYLLNRILKEGHFDILYKFNKELFTNEIIDEYGNKFIEYYKENIYMSIPMDSNPYFLKKVFETNSTNLLSRFSEEAYTESIVDEYYDVILEHISNNNNLVPIYMQNFVLFKRLMRDKKYYLIKTMDALRLNKVQIEEFINELSEIIEEDFTSPLAIMMMKNQEFLKKYIEICPTKNIGYIDKSYFNDKLNMHFPKLIQWIREYNNDQIPIELINNEKLKQYCKEQGLKDLYLNFAISSGIILFVHESDIQEYATLLGIPYKKLKRKIDFLKTKNDEILKTILPKMLLEKMEQIPVKQFMTISLYPDLQYEILNLNDEEFFIVQRILNYTNNSDIDITSILYNVLKNIKHYKKLIANSNNITDEQISNLIYILQRENNIFSISSIEELTDELLIKKILNLFSEYEKLVNNETNIDKLKEMLLLKKYGLDMSEAKFITERYCLDKNIVLNSELDENLKIIIIDLYDILNTNDIEELKFYFNTCDTVISDYRSMIYLEAQIRKEYAKLYSKQLYKIQESDSLENKKHLISNPDTLEQLSKVSYEGIKPQIYILSDDFNLEIHALGAYSDYFKPSNFLTDWNQPKMASHGVCTSYIGNNQIANARAYHPILGFDRIDSDSLLLAANYDIGSRYANLSYKTSKEMVTNFLPPEEIINYTRHTHNEIVIERMKYESGVVYKKAPSYIVYLLDDINNKYNFMTKKELVEEYRAKGKTDDLITKILNEKDTYFIEKIAKNNQITQEEANQIRNVFYYEEVVQASIDMGVPIVIVDRLYYAKRELKKCELIYETLITTDEIEYITLLFLTYFNNMVGCIDYTNSELEYNKCFNEDGFDKLFNKLLEDIAKKDKNIQLNYLDTILYELEKESYKRQTFKGGAPHALGKIDPYISTVKNKIDEIRLELTEVQNEPSTKPKK